MICFTEEQRKYIPDVWVSMSGSGNEHIMFKGLWEETLTREGLGTVADTVW